MGKKTEDEALEMEPQKNRAKDQPADSEPKQDVSTVMIFSSVSDVFSFSGRRTVVRMAPLKYKVLVDPDRRVWQECEINPIKAKKK